MLRPNNGISHAKGFFTLSDVVLAFLLLLSFFVFEHKFDKWTPLEHETIAKCMCIWGSHFHTFSLHVRVSNDRIQKSMANFGVTSKHATKTFQWDQKIAAKNGQHKEQQQQHGVFKWNATPKRRHLTCGNFLYYIQCFKRAERDSFVRCVSFAVVKKFSFHNLLT